MPQDVFKSKAKHSKFLTLIHELHIESLNKTLITGLIINLIHHNSQSKTHSTKTPHQIYLPKQP